MGCDPSGCFVLEYLNGKMILYTSKELPYQVLTNIPYKKGVDSLPAFQGFGGNRELSGPSPLARFARASYFLSTGGSHDLAAVFSSLSSLKVSVGNFVTKWSYVYDLGKKEIIFENGRKINLGDVMAKPRAGLSEKILRLPY